MRFINIFSFHSGHSSQINLMQCSFEQSGLLPSTLSAWVKDQKAKCVIFLATRTEV